MDNRADQNLFAVDNNTTLAALTWNLRDYATEDQTSVNVWPPSTTSYQPITMERNLAGMPNPSTANPTSANLLYRLNGLDRLDSESCTSPGAFQETSSAGQHLMPQSGRGQRVMHRQPLMKTNHAHGGQPHVHGVNASLMGLVLWMKSLEERMDRFEKTFAGWEPEVLQWLQETVEELCESNQEQGYSA